MRSRFDDQKSVLADCVMRLDNLEIPYMLTGSMAMVAYAMMRMTNDVDIVLEVRPLDAQRLIDEFEPDYYIPHGRAREAIDKKGMFNVIHNQAIVKIDCIVRKDEEFQRLAFSRRQRASFADVNLWVISRDDLIISKLEWYKKNRSEMQMRDVASMIRNDYDKNYVEHWVEKLDLAKPLEETRKYLEQNYVDGHDA